MVPTSALGAASSCRSPEVPVRAAERRLVAPPRPRSGQPSRSPGTVAGLALVHAAGAVGILRLVTHPSLATVALAVALYVVCGLGITAGYHRLFAHRAYRAAAPVRWVLLLVGA